MKHPIKSSLNSSGFTLIEMLVSITLFAIVMIMAFDVMSNIGILRNHISNRLDLNTELYNASERFISLIKQGGGIDYEEYWNRKTIGTATLSGHYQNFSGYGNYGSGAGYGEGIYYCTSGSGVSMGTGGCLTNTERQRYGQYRQQFMDYNSDMNEDGGDDNGDRNIIGDRDDENTGKGPSAFTGGIGMKELYLLKRGINYERTYFRWVLRDDPNGSPGGICEMSGIHMGSGNCLGNIQILSLVGRDLGLSHSGALTSSGKYDSEVDTWKCHADYNCPGTDNLPTGADSEWVDIFPQWIHVKNVDFFPYPEKDFKYAWAEGNDQLVLNSYVRMRIVLGLAWEKRKKITGGGSNDITITTTINLSQ